MELTHDVFPFEKVIFASTGYEDPTVAEPSPTPLADPLMEVPGGRGSPDTEGQNENDRPEEPEEAEQISDLVGVSR